MKIIFPGAGEKLVCRSCDTEIHHSFEFSESDDQDFPWCDTCIDFTHGIIKKK